MPEEDMPLFPDEMEINEMVPKTVAEIAHNLQIINAIEKRIEKLGQEKKDFAEWYNQKIEKAMEQIQRIESICKAYMEVENTSKVSTPRGTIYLATQKSIDWPSDATLCEWSKQNGLPILVKETPIKAPIKEYITITGNKPPGYEETNKTVIRRRNGTTQTSPDEVSPNIQQ